MTLQQIDSFGSKLTEPQQPSLVGLIGSSPQQVSLPEIKSISIGLFLMQHNWVVLNGTLPQQSVFWSTISSGWPGIQQTWVPLFTITLINFDDL